MQILLLIWKLEYNLARKFKSFWGNVKISQLRSDNLSKFWPVYILGAKIQINGTITLKQNLFGVKIQILIQNYIVILTRR